MSHVYYVTWDHRSAASASSEVKIVYLSELFEGTTTVDAAYKYYCDANAELPLHDSTFVLRDLQVQQRIYGLAGLMARRYDSSARNPTEFFLHNMKLTAQRNTQPMDLSNVINVLAQLDIRRGSSTFSDIIHAPNRQTMLQKSARPYTDFLPQFNDTWLDFLDAAYNKEFKLPLVPIT